MANRLDWNAAAGLITEPSDKEFEEDDLVAAEHLNWIIEQAERNFDDLEQLTFLDSGNVGQLKQLIVGASGLYRGGYDEGGVSFYTAFNAEWTGSDWEEIDDTKSEPSLIAYNVTDESQLNGVSSGDIGPNNWIVMYASSVSGSNVITWNTAPQVVNTLLLSDSDGDGNRWGLQEQVDGDLHVEHPDRADDYVFNEDGPTNDEDVADKRYVDNRPILANANYFDTPPLIVSGTASGQLDVTNNASFNDDAVALLLHANVQEEGGSSNPNYADVKVPSDSNFKRIAEAKGDSTDSNTKDGDLNSLVYPLENGKIDYDTEGSNGSVDLFAYAEVV